MWVGLGSQELTDGTVTQILTGYPSAVLPGHSLSKVDHHLGVNHTPVLPPTSPLFGNICHGQIQYFQQAVIGWKDRFGLGHFAQLVVKAFNDVGGIDQPPYLLRILEVSTQISPVIPPGLGNFGVFLVPPHSKSVQGIQSGLFIHSGIDRL